MGKSSLKKEKINRSNIDIQKLNILFFILFSIIITAPLFFRGTYFEKELLPTLIGIYSLFVIWTIVKSKNKDSKILDNPIDYLILGIVVIYGLSIFYGVNKRASLIEFSKYMSYLAIFLMAKDLSKDAKYKKAILNILLLGGLAVSIIGIGVAAGTWEYQDAVIVGRISSTFQYPNTLGAYVGSLYFIVLTMLINEENKILKGLYGVFLGTFVFTLILTYSRAMWLMFPIVALLYFIILPNRRKLESLIYMLSSAILSLPSSFLFTRAMESNGIKLWGIYLFVAIGTGGLVILTSLFDKKYRKVSIKALIISLGVIAVAILVAGVYIVGQTTEVVLKNESTGPTWSTFARNVSDIISENTYNLHISYRGENKDESDYLARVIIYNMDSKGQSKQILLEHLTGTGNNNIILPFTTEEDSIGVAIYIQNYYPNTSINVDELTITDETTNELIKNVPLRYKYIPESIVTRFSSISAGENSFLARMRFNLDGLQIVKKYFLFGSGGGGWVSLYQKYQSYPYWTTQAHNFFIQLLIEVGTIGFILLIGILVLITIYSLRTYRKKEEIESKALLAGLFSTIFAILLHAFVDFDMSLVAYAIVFWGILGVLVSNIDFNSIDKYFSKLYKLNLIPYVLVIITIWLGINSYMIITSNKYISRANEANDNMELDVAIENLEKAVKLDKYEPDYKLDLANSYKRKFEATGEHSYLEKANVLAEQYIKLSSFDSTAHALASSFNMSVGNIDEGLELLERTVELQPMISHNYIYKCDGYLSVFQYYYSKGEYEKAYEILEKALIVKEEIKSVNKRAYKSMSSNDELVAKIGEVEYLYKNFDILDEFYDNYSLLNFAYYFDLDINNDGNLDMLYSSVPEGSKITHDIVSEEDNYIRITNEGEVYGFKYLFPLHLEPNTTYVARIKARGTTKNETFNLYAYSAGTEEPNQGNLLNIGVTSDWKIYTLEFTTDSDIESGKQHIRIQHDGKDDGYIDIKELVIFEK